MFANSVTAAVVSAFLITFAIFAGLIIPLSALRNDPATRGERPFWLVFGSFGAMMFMGYLTTRSAGYFAKGLYPDGADIFDLFLIAALVAAFISGAFSAYKFFKNHVEPRLASPTH